ncbi:hypothetical protein U9M48_043789 [Paspalum notatum var. saurae]|uniref:Uncharacterized protein n=1 Tax=Paspalum notatum var. saurae TaxID=547442 RepID=A0AAQ3UXW4_PASNO
MLGGLPSVPLLVQATPPSPSSAHSRICTVGGILIDVGAAASRFVRLGRVPGYGYAICCGRLSAVVMICVGDEDDGVAFGRCSLRGGVVMVPALFLVLRVVPNLAGYRFPLVTIAHNGNLVNYHAHG